MCELWRWLWHETCVPPKKNPSSIKVARLHFFRPHPKGDIPKLQSTLPLLLAADFFPVYFCQNQGDKLQNFTAEALEKNKKLPTATHILRTKSTHSGWKKAQLSPAFRC